MDGRAAYDHLVEKELIIPENIVLFGRSFGASVAIDTALNRDARSIIIESGFTSVKDMAKSMFLFNLFSFAIPANYNNLNKIGNLSMPKLIMHGEEDEIVPFNMGKRLFDAANAQKYFYSIEGAGHNDTYVVGGEKYFQVFIDFVEYSIIQHS
jgi:fermentation-respiration switch protein FrsA (DUF1100 family)